LQQTAGYQQLKALSCMMGFTAHARLEVWQAQMEKAKSWFQERHYFL